MLSAERAQFAARALSILRSVSSRPSRATLSKIPARPWRR